MKFNTENLEYKIILDIVTPGSKVLELGCGEGKLLELLVKENKVNALGLEINESAIYKCVAKGLSVLHGDIEQGLAEYQDKTFDFVILDRIFQELKKPEKAIDEALRVGKKVIITFPNFVHYKARFQLFFRGKVPVTDALPYEWYNTTNLHFLSINDFSAYCMKRDIKIEYETAVSGNKNIFVFPNLFGELGLFVIKMEVKNEFVRK